MFSEDTLKALNLLIAIYENQVEQQGEICPLCADRATCPWRSLTDGSCEDFINVMSLFTCPL